MRKKILLLFSLVILCIPLMTHAQNYNQHFFQSYSPGDYYNQETVSSESVTTAVNLISVVSDKGTLDLTSGSTFNKTDLTTNIKVNWTVSVKVQKFGFSSIIYPKFSPVALSDQVTLISGKRATVTFSGIDANGVEKLTISKGGLVSGAAIPFSADELTSLRKYNNVKIKILLEDQFQTSETTFPVRLVKMPFTYVISTAPDNSQYFSSVSFDYADNYSPVPTINNSTSKSVTFLGESDTRISGLSEVGGHGSDHALNIAQSGSGAVILTQCNLSSLVFSLLNVDFTCQTVKSIVLQDASGGVKRTFTAGDYATIGANQIQLSLSNVVGIQDNDKLQIALTNSCTTNHESDYTIYLSTEGKKANGVNYVNEELFPDGTNKVPIAITQKGGTTWCDNSSAFFFDISGTNGYTNINFNNATPSGASFSVAKGQAAITGTANYYKCLTGVNIPVPTTKMPKTPVIADLEYCNGANFNLPIKNPSDYTTETFRLLLDGTEKVGWQGTKSFNGINLGKVGTASAVVESTNGECFISSSPATISSRIQPIALTFVGSLSYYTEQVNTTLVQTTQQDGVTYKIFKDGSATPLDTWIGIKAQTLTKGSYRITAENANASCSAETNLVIAEKDLNIGSAWVTTDLSFCQLEGTKDLNTFVSFNGTSSVIFTSTAGLSIAGSNVDLAASTPGTYTITCTAIKDGVTKVFTKNFTVKPKANDITLSLINTTDFSCNTNNPQIQVTTDYPGYNYTWYKGATIVDGTARTNTITLTKAEGSQNFTAVATATNGCLSSPSPVLTLVKNNLTADVSFTSGTGTFCQSIAGTANVFDDLTGADKISVSQEQSGYTYVLSSSSSDLILVNRNKIDLERSKAGTYTITMAYSQNGCTKSISKQYVIKQMPSAVTITLENASNIECDLNNVTANLRASHNAYSYNWYKKGTLLSDNTQSVSVPVSKADGATNIYAVPVLDGCLGLKTNEVSVTKRFVEANVSFSGSVTEYCQKTGGSIDIFTELSGTDKIAVVNSQSGYTWGITPSGTGLKMTGSVINLQTSQAGTYTVTMTISKDGCTKSITKDIVIRQRPADFTISLTNPTDFACNNSDAAMAASVTSYTYKWYKAGTDVGSGTTINIPITKADATDASRTIYAIGVAENTCETNPSSSVIIPLKTFLETDISISSGTATFCQSPVAKTTDIFDFLSGADKLAVTTKQHYNWSIVAPGLILSSTHEIDLQNSVSGTYSIAFTYQNEAGCAKTLNKTVVIKPKPSSVAVTLENASTIECDLTNPNALVKADNSAYSYNWYKKGTLLTDNTQAVSIPVSKADGATAIYAVPVLDGCIGLKSNDVSVTKRYVEGDFKFTDGVSENCQTVGTTLDMRSLLTGTDKDKIVNEQDGYTWDMKYSTSGLLFTDAKSSIVNLEKSFAQTYTSSLDVHRDGCVKTFTKDLKIKPRPIEVEISMLNADNIACNTVPVQFKASVSKYEYKWLRNENELADKTQTITLPVAKEDGLVSVYAVPVLDGCAGIKTNTIATQKFFVEADLVFSANAASYCQYPATKLDLFTELSGTDKVNVQTKQNGYTWSFTGSTPDLVIVGSEINLETSKPGSYTVTMTISKDGCSKNISKSVVIKAMPSNVVVTLDNASTVECDLTNTNALVHADNTAYTYNWSKNGTPIIGSTQKMSIPVSKTDALTSICAVPVLNSCIGLQSNTVSLTKRFVEVNFGFNDKAIALPSKDENINLFDYTTGKDKDVVINQTSGYTYSINFTPIKQTTIATTDGTVVPATGLQTGDTKYTLNVVVSKDGCSKTLSKDATIQSIPRNITIDFATKKDIQECSSNNFISVVASNPTLKYKWYKNDILVHGDTYQATIEVFKSDKEVKIYAIPSTSEGVDGYKTNDLLTTKRYVSADVLLDSKAESFCSVAGKKVNIFDYVRGADKAAVIAGQFGYTYQTSGDCGLAVSDNKYIDFDNSLSEDNAVYNVSLTVAQNGCTNTQTKSVTILRRPEDITIELLSKASNTAIKNMYCAGDSLELKASTSATNATYNWYKGTELITKTTVPSLKYKFVDPTGTINLSATSVFENGCQSTASNVVAVQKKDVTFNIDMATDPIAYCPEAKKINLFDYVSGNDKTDVMNQNNNCSYVFSASGNNGLAISSYSFLDLDNSTYSTTPYSLSFDVNKQGCVKSFTRQISIKPRPVTPLVTLTSNSELRYCGGDVVALTDKNAQTGTYYKWTVNGTDVVGSSSSILKYTTDQASEIGVQAISYFNSNSCPSKASDVLKVSNVVPRVDIKLINTTVTVNDLIQFYVFESTASKSIKLTATRVSDKTVTDLPYTREGNVITLSGILPIGEYSFSAIAENALTGYCSQNIVIANTLTVTNSTREGATNTAGAELVSSSDEIARKTIYDEYMAQLKKGEVHSILLPILTASYESAKLSVFTTDDNESVIIRIVDIQGHVISSRTEFLMKGENDFTIKGDDKPVVPGMYLINIDYSKAHKSETLKGLVK